MAESDSERGTYKDRFDRHAVKELSQQIAAVFKKFDCSGFERAALKNLENLEFADRVSHIASCLRSHLPNSIPRALSILTKSLPAPLETCDSTSDGWLQWPVGQFIADFGLEHYQESFDAMIQLTQRLTSEFAVRPFVQAYPERVFADLRVLTQSPNPHVRRWCSEGVRPLLPWGRKLNDLVEDPSPILPILDALKDDPELYVRRSVANNLNDIAKHHPNLVINTCKKWLDEQRTQDREWIIRHGLRTLVKQGNPKALRLLGYRPSKSISAEVALKSKQIKIGQKVDMIATISNSSTKPVPVLLDFVIHFVRKGGKTSAKVFKWKTLDLAANAKIEIAKSHPMRRTTVRALYPGTHIVELQANGQIIAQTEFKLLND